ncbi:hypothetical protein MACJ_002665 [Theileria orientalis]|uniref:SfiI-subtelomeric related protein family member n=1 Tax=Theileria orientalis TaxID=68886 RepID=A0A976M8X6_THEOR|nr:hypothetical protein MACJ_002665 [Theileria orientalis]
MNVIYSLLTLLTLLQLDLVVCPFGLPHFDSSTLSSVGIVPEPPNPSQTNDTSRTTSFDLDSDNESQVDVANTPKRGPNAQPVAATTARTPQTTPRAPVLRPVSQPTSNSGSGSVPRKSVQATTANPQPLAGSAQQATPVGQPAPKSVPLDSEAESDIEVVTPSSRASPAQATGSQAQPAAVPRAPQTTPRAPVLRPVSQPTSNSGSGSVPRKSVQATTANPQPLAGSAQQATPVGQPAPKSVPLDSEAESDIEVVTPSSRASPAQATGSQAQPAAVPRAPQTTPRAPVLRPVSQPTSNSGSGSVPRKSVQATTANPQPLAGSAQQATPVGQPAPKSVPLDSEAESDIEVVTPSSRASPAQATGSQAQPAAVPRAPQTRAVPVESQPVGTNTPARAPQTTPLAPTKPNQPQFITIELNNKKSNKYYTYVWDETKYAHLFIPKAPYIVNKVTNNTVVPWTYQGGKYPNEVRIAFDESDNPSLELDFPDDGFNPQSNFITVELRNKRSDDTYAYLWDQNQYAHLFIPRSPFIVNRVTNNGEIAWTHQGGKYPIEVRIAFDQDDNPSLELDFGSDIELEPQPSVAPAQQATPVGQPAPKSVPLDSEAESDIEVVTPSSRASPAQATGSQAQPAAVPRAPAKPTHQGRTQLISVDITYFASTNEVDYLYYQRENVHKFLCKQGFLIYELKKGPKVKWRYQSGDYPNRVLLIRDQNNSPIIRVLTPNDYDPDEPTSLPQPKLVSVDITYFASTNEVDYLYYQRENVHKFLCKQGFLIYELKKGPKVKWRYQSGDYPNRVLLIRDQNNSPIIRVLTPNDYDPDEPTSLPQPKLVSVDITYFASTNEVDYLYYQRENVHKFLCKQGFLIYELKKGPKVKWRYQSGDYPNRVLLIRDQNNSPIIRVLTPNDYDPDEPTSLPQPKLVSVDITYFASTNEVDYLYYQREDVHKFLCKQGFLIYELKKGPKVKWRYQSGDYPNRVLLIRDQNNSPIIRVLTPNDYDPDEPGYVPPFAPVEPEPTLKPVEPVPSYEPGLITVNVDNLQSTDKIEYSYDPVYDAHIFKTRGSLLFNQVIQKGKVIWKPKNNRYGNRVVIKTGPDGKQKAKMHYPDEVSPRTTAEPFLSEGPSIPDYVTDVEEKPSVRAPSPVSTGVPIDLEPGIEGEPFVGAPTPVSTGVPIDLESVVEELKAPEVTPSVEPVGFLPTPVQPGEKSFPLDHDEGRAFVTGAEEPIIPKEPAVIKPVPEKPEGFVYEPEPGVKPDYRSKAPITLNIRSSSSKNGYDYDKDKSKNTKIYTALDGFGFASVKYGGCCCSSEKTLWEAKGDKHYGSKVEHIDYWYKDMEELNIDLYDGTKRKFYKNYVESWTEVDLSKLNCKTMNISMTEESYFHTTTSKDGIKIYVSKRFFAFDNLIEWPYPGLSTEKPVWNTNNPEEYATEIFRDGIGCSSIKNVTMHLINGDYRHVKKIKSGLNSTWVEKSSHIDLDLNQKKSGFEYTYTKYKDTHIYEANFNFLFTKVQILKGSSCCNSETIIWERNDTEPFANKVVFTSYVYDHMYDAIIHFNDGTKRMFIKNQKKSWTEIKLSKKYSIYLNIEALKDTYFYTFKRDGSYGTFEAKEPFVFSSLVEFKRIGWGTKTVWRARNPDQYAVSVVIDGPKWSKYTKNATLYFVDGSSLRLTRTGSLGCTPSFCCFFTLGLFNCCAKTWEKERTVAVTKPEAPVKETEQASGQQTTFDFDDDGPTVVSGGSRNCFNSCSGCNSCGSYGGYTENISTGDISKTSNDSSDESNQRDKSSTVDADDPKFHSKSAKTIEHEFLFKTEHNSESSEINPNYDLNNSGSTYVLDFKDKVKCVEVKCRKCQTIWKNKPGTTSSLHFTKELSNLDFCSSVSDLISYDFIIKTEDYKTPSKDNDYNYDMRKSGTTYALNFKNDVECAEVKYCTISTIWKHDSSTYWKRYPKSISHNTQNQRTFVRFYGDEFNENSVDQSDIFENTAFPEYELSHYTGESINNYSFTSQQTVQG